SQREPESGAAEIRARGCVRVCAADAAERGKVGRGGARPAEVYFHARRPRQLGGAAEIRGPESARDLARETRWDFRHLLVLGFAKLGGLRGARDQGGAPAEPAAAVFRSHGTRAGSSGVLELPRESLSESALGASGVSMKEL